LVEDVNDLRGEHLWRYLGKEFDAFLDFLNKIVTTLKEGRPFEFVGWEL
jgi:hypothetical protein